MPKRNRLKKSEGSRKKKRLVAINVAIKEEKKIQADAIKKGFVKKLTGTFYEMTVPLAPNGDAVYVNVQIKGKVYDKALDQFAEDPSLKKKMTPEEMQEFDDYLNSMLRDGLIEQNDIFEIYIDRDELVDLKKTYPQIRTKEHSNTLFAWIHPDDFMEVLRERIIATE